jgi:hypothetical protein
MRLSRRQVIVAGLALPTATWAQEAEADPLYARTLSAYRGALNAAEIEAHAAEDPGPALYLGEKTPGETGVARLFAALPDAAHAELRRRGYLKWPLGALPETQRGWLRERLRQFERRGDGPYPADGADPAHTGFMRVELEDLEGPQYAWWIAHPKARRDNWQTLVRVVRILAPGYDTANRERLKEVAALPETAPIARGAWLRVKEPPPAPPVKEPPPEPLMDEKLFRSAVKAYRGDLGGEARVLLGAADPLIGRRLKLTDPADLGPQRLFGRLKAEQLDQILYSGRLTLRTHDLTRDQLRPLEPTVARLNTQTRDLGLGDAYALIPYGPTTFGFALVLVPEVPRPALSWWIRSPVAPTPAWVTLINDAALKAPLYFQAHLEQLR